MSLNSPIFVDVEAKASEVVISDKTKGKFRICAKQFFMTYPQCDIPKQWMYDFLMKKYAPTYLLVAHEFHKVKVGKLNPGHHLHVHMHVARKLDIKNCSHFDVEWENEDEITIKYHGNYQSVKNTEYNVAYCKKDGDYVESDGSETFCLELIEMGKRKNCWFDLQWYKGHNVRRRMNPIEFPIVMSLVDGRDFTLDKPDPSVKRRHYWFIGPPDSGKSYYFNSLFACKKLFKPSVKHPFEDYHDEEIILYDDCYPETFADIANITGTHNHPTRVPGDHRFVTRYWEIGSTRTIIVLSNKSIEEIYNVKQKRLTNNDLDAFRARFIVVKDAIFFKEERDDEEHSQHSNYELYCDQNELDAML